MKVRYGKKWRKIPAPSHAAMASWVVASTSLGPDHIDVFQAHQAFPGPVHSQVLYIIFAGLDLTLHISPVLRQVLWQVPIVWRSAALTRFRSR
jgi:hypothetical protein